MDQPRRVTRSNTVLASFQIEGLCKALRELVLRGIEPGDVARGLLRSLRDTVVGSVIGATVEHIPEVTKEALASDLLVVAEVLRATMLAFLTPEEAEEQRGTFGFHGKPMGSG